MPLPLGAVTKERAREWLQCLEVGGKELIQSQQDSRLQSLSLICTFLFQFLLLTCQALEATAMTVNLTRIKKGLPQERTTSSLY